MFHKIYHMYIDIKNKEETNAALLLTSMSDQEYINKVIKKILNSHENHHNEFPLQVRMIVPPNLHQIQPRANRVWNCDEIGLNSNGKWRKVVCIYNYFQGEIMWKVQTGERALFWCTLLVFTRADGKCFVPPVVVHQSKEYSQDLHHSIPLDWTVYHTPYGYMDRDEWLNVMTQLSNKSCPI